MTSPTDEFGAIKDYYNHLDIDPGSTAAEIKGGVAKFHGYYFYNDAITTLYLKLYDKATAPTAADTPKLVYGLPPRSSDNLEIGGGIKFTLGCWQRVVTGKAHNNNTGPATNDVLLNIYYR